MSYIHSFELCGLYFIKMYSLNAKLQAATCERKDKLVLLKFVHNLLAFVTIRFEVYLTNNAQI